MFATGQLLKRFGTGVAAGALPAVYLAGFAAMALAPTLLVVLVVQVAQRWMNFAIANPARQVFFTVVARGEKYKAKNLIDVVVYRGSDALYGWVFDSLQALGLKLGAIAYVHCRWWRLAFLSAVLGRTQERRAAASAARRRETDDAPSLAATLACSRPPRCWRGAAFAQARRRHSITRAIPSTGERLPAVGLGTASVFDSDGDATRSAATEVVRTLVNAGGRLIDTASTYGDAEIVLGAVIAAAGWRDKVFVATKLEQPDAEELKRRSRGSRRRSSTCCSSTM